MSDLVRAREGGGDRWELILGRKEQRNALSDAMVAALSTALDEAESAGARMVVLRSSTAVFCAGLDLSALDQESDTTLAARLNRIAVVLDSLDRRPYLTVALVEGPAVGAGADLAMACDLRIGTPAASFRFPGFGFGVVLGTVRLAQLLGEQRALSLALTGARLDAAHAEAHGALETAADDAAATDLLDRYAASLAAVPAPAVAALLAALRSGRPAGGGTGHTLRTTIGTPGLVDRVTHYKEAAFHARATRP